MESNTLRRIVEAIARKKGISRDEVLRMVEEERRRLGGIPSLEVAAYLLASKLGVKVELEKTEKPGSYLKLADLMPGMRRVRVLVRVARVYNVLSFKPKTGEEKLVARLKVTDGEKDAYLLLWGVKAEIVAKKLVKTNDVLEVSGAYVKRGRKGLLEISVDENATVNVNPGVGVEIPSIKREFIKLSELERFEGEEVDVEGYILSVRRGVTPHGRKVYVLADDTRQVRLVIPERHQAVNRLNPGVAVRVYGVKVGRLKSGTPILHATLWTPIETVAEGLGFKPYKPVCTVTKAYDLAGKTLLCTLTGVVSKGGDVKGDGEKANLTFQVTDGNRQVRVVVWGELALKLKEAKRGDILLIEEGELRRRGDSVEVHVGAFGSVKKLEESEADEKTRSLSEKLKSTFDVTGVLLSRLETSNHVVKVLLLTRQGLKVLNVKGQTALVTSKLEPGLLVRFKECLNTFSDQGWTIETTGRVKVLRAIDVEGLSNQLREAGLKKGVTRFNGVVISIPGVLVDMVCPSCQTSFLSFKDGNPVCKTCRRMYKLGDLTYLCLLVAGEEFFFLLAPLSSLTHIPAKFNESLKQLLILSRSKLVGATLSGEGVLLSISSLPLKAVLSTNLQLLDEYAPERLNELLSLLSLYTSSREN